MFNTIEVIAASVAAYQINGNRYIKTDDFILNNEKNIWSNKEIVKSHFAIDHYASDHRPPRLIITEEHREIAQKIKDYSKKNLFLLIGKNPETGLSYDATLYQLLNQETVTSKDFGYIASSPQNYYKSTKQDELKKRLVNSQHVGTIGGKVVLENFEVIKKIKSKNFNGTIIQGICEDNLYFYFVSNEGREIPYNEGDIISIEAKVKEHIMEKNMYPMTKLTYVRPTKGINNATSNTVRIDNNSYLLG